MVSDQCVEATAILRAPADEARLAHGLSARGLRAQPLRVGLFIRGDQRSY